MLWLLDAVLWLAVVWLWVAAVCWLSEVKFGLTDVVPGLAGDDVCVSEFVPWLDDIVLSFPDVELLEVGIPVDVSLPG